MSVFSRFRRAILVAASLLASGTALAAPGANVFGKIPALQSVALSPDGQRVAWVGVDERQQVTLVDLATGKSTVVPVQDNLKLRRAEWADDRTLLLEVSVTKRVPYGKEQHEFYRFFAVDLETRQTRGLLMDDSARSWVTGAHLVAARTSQPDTVVMSTMDFSETTYRQETGTRLHKERRDSGWSHDIFAVDVRTGTARRLDAGSGYTQEWVVDAAGLPVARSEWDAKASRFTVVARQPGGSWKEIYRLENGNDLGLAGLTPDGRSVVAIGSDGSGLSRLWALPLDGSGAKPLIEDATRDVVSVEVDPHTGRPVGAWLGGAEPELRWLDQEAGAKFAKLSRAFPGRNVQVIGRSARGDRVLSRVSGPSVPPVYYLVDFTANKADIVGEAYPALEKQPLGAVTAITYPARDGTQIPAYLTLPPGSTGKGLPMVVLPHGGPEANDEFDFDWLAQFLATRGYAVLQPQFRGSTGFGDAFRKAGYGEWGGLMQDDVSDGVKALIAQGVADPKRVCIVGASYGGYAALAGVTLTPELYACAVSINGLSDLPAAVGQTRASRGEESDSYVYWRKSIGSTHDDKLAQRSPARIAGKVQAPVLLLHGVEDTVVPVTQSRAMARALQSAGKPHEYLELPGEDHWLSRSKTRIKVLEETERFLAAHLGGASGGASAPASP